MLMRWIMTRAGQHAITMEGTIPRLGGATHGDRVRLFSLVFVDEDGRGFGRFRAGETTNTVGELVHTSSGLIMGVEGGDWRFVHRETVLTSWGHMHQTS